MYETFIAYICMLFCVSSGPVGIYFELAVNSAVRFFFLTISNNALGFFLLRGN